MQVPLLRLQCGCNSYEWGKVGKSSAAARFASATPSDSFSIQNDKPYAELWMGTHPSNPSKDLSTGRTLLDMVQDNQSLMSTTIAEKYNQKLPFLFKVLSINKALSIQAHPNKKLAEQVHARDPKNYPDDNHKPEMTIAITPFDGLCGFRPLGEIAHFLQHVPSLRQLVGEQAAKNFEDAVKGQETTDDESKSKANKKALQAAFTALMESKPEQVEKLAPKLISQAQSEGPSFAGSGVPSTPGNILSTLLLRLNTQFPSDIGLFVSFFLNYIQLDIGEALFLKADDIHAYLSGDIIECMASSDNVVRAGFTPKFKDVGTLTSMLTYSYAPIAEQKMAPGDYHYCKLNSAAYSSNSTATLYDPPIEEFSVVRTALKSAGAKITFEAIDGPSIVICTQGEGRISVGPKTEEMKEGYVYFVGATAELVVESSASGEMVTFKAFCELGGKEGSGEKTNGASNGKM
ncbi:Mannose-6-phosphate isomerase [Friedmanniomyces endolithicus]|nr:Mannose-6-phosphate isomerase [Friedmanniomyces endolithicus]KAK0786664.1 Mannose-6-phosphate isomerase [Friedmanniomyces endolithicus]KAK0798406.1 Mannose-6-phosphate isomerase [Friedmanniomyces endolithicus]KAK0805511.1 Mannose-6-phosphate isomerase [Friedmanniomyces endolithicus]KAK0855602.1 Mannose-6-phosphate isomerase [Friedmanniomyces endolithicus]